MVSSAASFSIIIFTHDPLITPFVLQPQLEEAIRAGDCLAMLVEHYFANKQYNEAYQYLQVGF